MIDRDDLSNNQDSKNLDQIKSNVFENRLVNGDIRTTLYKIQSNQENHHKLMLQQAKTQTVALKEQAKALESLNLTLKMAVILLIGIGGSMIFELPL